MALSVSGPSSLAGVTIANRRQQDVSLQLARLSSGLKVASAKDGAADLVISQQLRANVVGVSQASDGLLTASSLLQTADSGLDATSGLLRQQRQLALQMGNSGALDDAQRSVLEQQFQDLGKAIDQVSTSTSFGRKPLLDGSFTDQVFQVGGDAGQTVPLSIRSELGGAGSGGGFDRAGLGLAGATLADPEDAISRIDKALSAVGTQRSTLGSLQTHVMDSVGESLANTLANLEQSLSIIADTDMAQAASQRAQSSVLHQSAIAGLAQQNLSQSRVLSLLT